MTLANPGTPRRDDATLIERAAERLAALSRPEPPMIQAPPEARLLHEPPEAPLIQEPPVVPLIREPLPPQGLLARRTVTLDCRLLAAHQVLTAASQASATTDEFHLLGYQLRQRIRDRTPPVRGGGLVLVSSPKPGDGKTFVACNLAVALARQDDVEVILVDGNLTRPAVARRLGLAGGRGLSDYLADPAVTLDEVVVATDLPGFLVLPAGAHRGNPDAGRRLSGLLTALRGQRGERERIVVFDSPPLLAGSMAPLLAPLVDQILVVVTAGRTQAAAVDETRKRLQAHEAKCAYVFNRSGGALHRLTGADHDHRGDG